MPPLTQDQARRVHDHLGPMVASLTRLVVRLECVGYLPTDPYYLQATAARNAVFDLRTHTHSLACGGKWDGRQRSLGRDVLLLPFVGKRAVYGEAGRP